MTILVAVLFSTFSLDEKVATDLYEAALLLFARQLNRLDLKTPDYEGAVTTEWKVAALGTFAGPVFHAQVDVGDVSGKVEFIVPERWLETDVRQFNYPAPSTGDRPRASA